MPSAVRSGYLPRIAEREDYTRRVETEYEQIIRHGTARKTTSGRSSTSRERSAGTAATQTRVGRSAPPEPARPVRFRNDKTRDAGSILTDSGPGNGYRWYLAPSATSASTCSATSTTPSRTRASRAGNGTGWQAIPDGQTCASGRTCAKHVYLYKILYTGAGEASGHGEDPAYEVVFIRGDARRPDAALDARGGFLDLDQERLTQIEVRYRETNQLVTRYDLAYDPGRFGKSRLISVTQVGCAGAATCERDHLGEACVQLLRRRDDGGRWLRCTGYVERRRRRPRQRPPDQSGQRTGHVRDQRRRRPHLPRLQPGLAHQDGIVRRLPHAQRRRHRVTRGVHRHQRRHPSGQGVPLGQRAQVPTQYLATERRPDACGDVLRGRRARSPASTSSRSRPSSGSPAASRRTSASSASSMSAVPGASPTATSPTPTATASPTSCAAGESSSTTWTAPATAADWTTRTCASLRSASSTRAPACR